MKQIPRRQVAIQIPISTYMLSQKKPTFDAFCILKTYFQAVMLYISI